jgi:hypothetical protein
MRVKFIDGFYYSTAFFETYKFRAQFNLVTTETDHNFEIYTTNPSRDFVEELFVDSVRKKFKDTFKKDSKIILWKTRQEDDENSTIIDQIFQDESTGKSK